MRPIPSYKSVHDLSSEECFNNVDSEQKDNMRISIAEYAKRDDERQEKTRQEKSQREIEEKRRWEEKWKEDFSTLLRKGVVFRFLFWSIAVFVVAYISSNFISLIKLLSESSGIIRIVIGFVFLVLFVTCCICMYYAWRLFRRLPKFNTIQEGTEDKELYQYIQNFPDAANFKGVYSGDVEFSDAVRDLKTIDIESDGYWEVERRFKDFQTHQEGIAKDIVKKCAKATGVKVIAMPWKAGDVIIVFINSILMVCAIARVYNRRLDKHQALRYVFKWLGGLYVAGQAQEMGDAAADEISRWFEDGSGLFIGVFRKVAGRAAEGCAVAWIVYRLGKIAIKEFSLMRLR